MPPASRITDMHTCPMVTGIVPHVGGPILPPGEPTVLIGMLPAARMTDMATCVGPPDTILMGSPTVLIGNLMAARIGDPTVHGGVIVLGEPTVEIGEVGMGTPTVVTPAPPLVILAQAMSGSGSAAAQAVSNAAQDLAQASQDGASTVALTLANQPLANTVGAPAQEDADSRSPSDAELAAQEGDSPAQQGARIRVATAFYNANCPDKDDADIESHVGCIDLHKPVEVVTVPPQGGGANGNDLWQWAKPGAAQPGEYFTNDPLATTESLGVDQDARELRQHTASEPMTALKSTAAATENTWSPENLGEVYPGGGTQLFIPKGQQKGL